ncbi:MAG: HAD family hydrolase [Thermaurantiacus sp.]
MWDVGHVLYDWDPKYLYQKLIPDPERLDWFLDHVVTKRWHFQHDAGRQLADTVPELVAEHPSERHLIELYGPRWLETIPGPVPGTHEIVLELADAGVPLFGITNFGAEFWSMFRPTAALFDLFEDVIVSGEEKMMKPDPAIWALAERRFGLQPSEIFFIDDNPANIAGARAAGWHAHRFLGADAARAALVLAGLLPRGG